MRNNPLPARLGPAGFGYSSSKWFDISGLWSADAELTEIATKLYTQTEASAGKYDRIALVAHSMGGLVVQQAIADHDDLRDRVSHVVLFGTPSNGLEKAGAADFWKRQIDNMVAGGPFITALRKAWNDKNLDHRRRLRVSERGRRKRPVRPAGIFTPLLSRQRLPGHRWQSHSMLEGDTLQTRKRRRCFSSSIAGDARKPKGARGTAHVAIEKGEFQDIIKKLWPEYLEGPQRRIPKLDDYGAGQLAMALEKTGDSDTAIKLLTDITSEGTDVLGILAGRLKRRWWLKSLKDDRDQALQAVHRGIRQGDGCRLPSTTIRPSITGSTSLT